MAIPTSTHTICLEDLSVVREPSDWSVDGGIPFLHQGTGGPVPREKWLPSFQKQTLVKISSARVTRWSRIHESGFTGASSTALFERSCSESLSEMVRVADFSRPLLSPLSVNRGWMTHVFPPVLSCLAVVLPGFPLPISCPEPEMGMICPTSPEPRV